MSRLFPNLFSPLEIKGTRFKNRLFFAAHGTGYAEDGGVGSAGYEYYRARVTQGTSLLVTEATQVVPLPGQKYAQLNASDDSCIPQFSRIADLCHENDCRYFVQLFHAGRAHYHSPDGTRPANLSASSIPDERHHGMPVAMSENEIFNLSSRFGEGAKRAMRAGADGIQLLAGMGYLHAQFLSRGVNHRNDRYGGSLENRSRFLFETLTEIRKSTCDDFIVGVRIAAEEYDPDGMQLEETLEVCSRLERMGLVDYLDICAAGTHGLVGSSHIVPSMFVETGQTLHYSEAVKKEVTVPVFTCGRINQPQDGERAVANGQADMIGMVRALIADPEFVEKSRQDRPEEIRACIACNQACIGHRLKGYGVSCIQHPETGRESEFARLVPAETSKNIIVVGGGPAGMKAAVIAARRGHRVTLYEKSSRLGGQVQLAEKLPGRSEFGGVTTNLENELERYGVDVVTNTEMDGSELQASGADAAVIATGALPIKPPESVNAENAVCAWEVIQGQVEVGQRVVVADFRCDWIGMGIAEKLASGGHSVRLYVNGEMAGQTVQRYVRYQWIGRLHKLGIEVTPYSRLYGSDDDSVYFEHVITGQPMVADDVDTLVYALGHQSRSFLQQFPEPEVPVYFVGDCVSPRTVEEAVLEGLRAGVMV